MRGRFHAVKSLKANLYASRVSSSWLTLQGPKSLLKQDMSSANMLSSGRIGHWKKMIYQDLRACSQVLPRLSTRASRWGRFRMIRFESISGWRAAKVQSSRQGKGQGQGQGQGCCCEGC